MNTLEDLHQRLINIGKLISEVIGLFSHVKLTKHELDIVFHNLDSGKIEEVLDDLKNVISQQRLQNENIHDIDTKENEILPVIKQETDTEGWYITNLLSFSGFIIKPALGKPALILVPRVF